ncbi:hypothetical protein NKR19_g304 [Coniochaeta hoffmannii]|uniref:Small secreted protein n=1 Tax=Coniochaeta hoffmannii TaxID=91930 RepID=A0AA38W1U2_9PEZI|nr:hypothetical protein NKR19_g304 [Coniochaeta hoffmannii]
MKSIILTLITFASLTAAWGTVEFCVNRPEVNPGYECASYAFYNEGCWDLPRGDGSFGHPNLRGNTHFVALSGGISCDMFDEVGCTGYTFPHLTEPAVIIDFTTISSVKCYDWK